MQVNNGDFFHIHRIGKYSDMWKIGQKFNIAQRICNPFYQYCVEYSRTFDGKGLHASVTDFFTADDEYRQKNMERFSKFVTDATKEILLLERELIFEDVREEFFPTLPSRQSCLWACDRIALDHWWKTLDKPSHKIFKLGLTGNAHTADARYVGGFDIPTANTFRALAFNYWSGSNGSKKDEEEILFEGIAEVKEEYLSLDDLKTKESL